MENITDILTEKFIRVANKWSAINARPIEIAKDYELTASEIHFIDAIWRHERVNVTGLAEILGVTKGAISQTVANLAEKGILQKDGDARNKKTVLLTLTDKGKQAAKFHENLHAAINAKLSGVFDGFDCETIERASEMLARVEALFDGMNETVGE